jgi:hypothetical protein
LEGRSGSEVIGVGHHRVLFPPHAFEAPYEGTERTADNRNNKDGDENREIATAGMKPIPKRYERRDAAHHSNNGAALKAVFRKFRVPKAHEHFR